MWISRLFTSMRCKSLPLMIRCSCAFEVVEAVSWDIGPDGFDYTFTIGTKHRRLRRRAIITGHPLTHGPAALPVLVEINIFTSREYRRKAVCSRTSSVMIIYGSRWDSIVALLTVQGLLSAFGRDPTQGPCHYA